MSKDLPDDVARFLEQHIGSVMQLEVLLALRAAGEPLSTRQLIRSLGGSVDQVLQCTLALERDGFVEQLEQGGDLVARYAATGATDQRVAAVADAYAKRKVRVVTFVLQGPADPLESFSDAFKLRKDR